MLQRTPACLLCKNFRFYHVLTIQEYSGHNRKLSVFKQQHINLQTEHGKGYNWHFIELKDTKHGSK